MVDADGATKFEDIEKLECAATNLRKKHSKVNSKLVENIVMFILLVTRNMLLFINILFDY